MLVVPLLAGLVVLALSLAPHWLYMRAWLRIAGAALTALGIFACGAGWSNAHWRAQAAELQQAADRAAKQSQEASQEIAARVVERTKIVQVRGANTVQYIEREVKPRDAGCVIPPEFVLAHNRAAEVPR